jgi:hypothetical protein
MKLLKPAVIVGNGVSRKNINLNDLVGQATIFGCNALYRDFDKWDYLITIDQGMTREIRNSEGIYGNGTVIIPPYDEQFEPAEYSPNRRRSNAGMNAMIEAIRKEHDVLYCLGFDFVLKGQISTDNIYRNTENYGPETHASQSDNYYRIKYLEWFLNKYCNVNFVFVYPDNSETNPINAENLFFMDESVFVKKINE